MKNKYVIITGASRGIGNAIAEKFASQGYNLILTCNINIELLNKLCGQLEKKYSVLCYGFKCDGGSSESVASLFDNIKKLIPDIDIVINNAGISHMGLLQDMSNEQWENVITSNLTSVFYMCRSIIPHFVHNKYGRIINISSVWGEQGASCEAAYSASKAGINGLTKALAKELAPSGIQVNAIAFGAIDTEMNSFLSDNEKKVLEEEIPFGRMATPQEAASFVYQLAHSEPYLTGQIISFNGGWY
ncbi:MAG: SDR family NAD(P)-dependent oxidoreductase [Lachnospiraceae bacterium]|nr:SDR family NAD(P)-dependent oxidoreductase [Lachnospiraceae bacterium]MDE6254254.1 SDR family NAD(P)-dependent oxidoreductase [Lachnospiraceae bacterium]